MSSENQRNSRIDIDREVTHAVARLKAGILGMVFGVIFAVGLFGMTAILLIEDGPDTGLHLRLLGNYFIGYSVTWKGAVIGSLWAFVIGVLIGSSIGCLYNRIVGVRRDVRNR